MKSRGTSRIYWAAAIAGCAFAASGPAWADAMDNLLDKLLAKGALTKQDYDQLKTEKAQEQKAAPPVVTPSNAPSSSAFPPAGDQGLVRMMDPEKGIGLHVGPVDVTVSGEINGFYVHDSPDTAGPTHVIDGGLAAVGSNTTSAVRNGLLPGNFAVDLKTKQEGLDIVAHFGLYPGLNNVSGVGGANSSGTSHALGTSGIDFRQQYLTIGSPDLGTFKVGRDIGLFGQEAILNDFTLFGVGSTGSNTAPSNTSLGRIGLGYVYTDWIPQITYTTPTFAGFAVTAGIFQPFDAFNFSGDSGTLGGHDSPQIQAKIAYTVPFPPSSGFKGQLWTNVVTQELKSGGGTDALATGKSVQGTGWDFGGKLDYGPAELVAYGYIGDGLGTTGLFFDAVSPEGKTRSSDGYLFQGSYTFFNKLTLSGSYGLSHLDLASGEFAPTLVKDNESYAFGAKYHLTSWVNLIAEYTHTTSTAHNGNSASDDAYTAGAIAFF
ncbi:MAG TPA: porin [Aliidongia sp.]|nr:porin [Aliidongia sp.]